MNTPSLVRDFYERLWHRGEFDAATELLAEDFRFRGSLGVESVGRDAFLGYVSSVRSALSDYRCDILACVTEGDEAVAKMRFSGRHTARFRDFDPTGQRVEWLGVAWFRFAEGRIAELWVLGDLASLDRTLAKNSGAKLLRM
jgi:steroid delta-isomerase-like uncharacterized protein